MPIPTTNEIYAWLMTPAEAKAAADRLRGPAGDMRIAVGTVLTTAPVGIYLNRNDEKQAGLYPYPGAADEDIADAGAAVLTKAATGRLLDLADLDTGDWVRIGTTPTVQVKSAENVPFLRRAGEWLNFFPSSGAIPNAPYPMASTLTSGLLGAGLGYGAGWLGEQLMPERWERGRLRKTLGLAGLGGGALFGAMPGFANLASGRNFNDNSALNVKYKAPPEYPDVPKAGADKFASLQLAECKAAGFDTFAEGTGPVIDVDALGRTLWSTASPQTAGVTMGLVGAAAGMPGGVSTPGFVTPLQMGALAAHMGAGYVSGAIVGNVLGALTGLPDDAQKMLKRTGLYAGIVRAVVPKMFGG